MKRFIILALIATMAFCSFAMAAAAAPAEFVQGYIMIPGITDGAGTVPGYTDYSEILGFAFDTKGPSGSGTASESAKFTMTITKAVDEASPRLMLAAAKGTTLGSGYLVFTKSASGYYVSLWNVKITEVRQHYDALDAVQPGPGVLEDVTFRFGRIVWEDNGILTGWDVARNRQYTLPE